MTFVTPKKTHPPKKKSYLQLCQHWFARIELACVHLPLELGHLPKLKKGGRGECGEEEEWSRQQITNQKLIPFYSQSGSARQSHFSTWELHNSIATKNILPQCYRHVTRRRNVTKKKYIHDAFKIELWRPIHHIITSSQRLDVDGLCYHRAAHTALPRLNMQKQFRIACLQSMAGRADGALQIVDVEYSIARFEIYLLYV